jgi:hypothetical protein
MSDASFKDTDAATVFDEVSKRAETEETQSLWDKLLTEVERKGVGGAVSYLESEFQRIGDDLNREIARLKTGQ